MSGLDKYNLLKDIREKPSIFKLLFCYSDIFTWTYDVFMGSHKTNWAADGSNKKSVELKTYRAFIEMMELSYYDGMVVHVHVFNS